MPPAFKKATKRSSKLRLALDGTGGSGKSYSALSIATTLGDRVAAVDTERGSLSLYSDMFDFDVAELAPPYEPRVLVEKIKAAQAAGYEVLVIDSLSHFWEGEGGVMDMVDAAAARAKGNKFAGWKVGTPAYRNMIDTMLGADMHVICGMRSKTEYILETGDGGKTAPKRVGMAPAMRQGIEYEFTVIGDIDLEHTITITKSRCNKVADQVYHAHREKDLAETLKSWLNSGAEPADPDDVADIRQAISAIADPDRRNEIKREFNEKFGMTDFLLDSQIAEAKTWVTERTTVRNGQAREEDSQHGGEGTLIVGPASAGDASDAASPSAEDAGEVGDPVKASSAQPGPDQPAPTDGEPPDPETPTSWDVNDSVPRHEDGHMPTKWRNEVASRLAKLGITSRDQVGLVIGFATAERSHVVAGVKPNEAESVIEAVASLESGELVLDSGVITTKRGAA